MLDNCGSKGHVFEFCCGDRRLAFFLTSCPAQFLTTLIYIVRMAWFETARNIVLELWWLCNYNAYGSDDHVIDPTLSSKGPRRLARYTR